MTVIIQHPQDGIYLGSFLGLGFWTKLDMAGQKECVTFPDKESTIKYIQTWDTHHPIEEYEFVEVNTDEWYLKLCSCGEIPVSENGLCADCSWSEHHEP